MSDTTALPCVVIVPLGVTRTEGHAVVLVTDIRCWEAKTKINEFKTKHGYVMNGVSGVLLELSVTRTDCDATFPLNAPSSIPEHPQWGTLYQAEMGKQVSLRNLLANFKFFVKILHGDGQVPQARYAGGVDVDNKRVADDTVVMSYEEWLERPWHSYLGREDQCCLERQRWHFKSLRSSAAFGLGTFDHNNDGTPCHTLLPESGISDFIERMYEMGQENPKVFTAWDLACHSIVRNVVTAIVGFENSQFPFSGWVPDWFKVLLPYVDRLSDALKDEPTTIESLRAIQVSVPGCAEYPLFHSCFPASASKLADLLRLLIACLQKDKSLMIGTVPREVYDPFLAAVPIYAGSSKKKVRKGLALDDCAVPAGSHFVGPNLTRGKTAEKRKLNALD